MSPTIFGMIDSGRITPDRNAMGRKIRLTIAGDACPETTEPRNKPTAQNGSTPSTLIANTLPSRISGSVFDFLSAHTSTSGGSSDTSVNADTVMPWMCSPLFAVTIATPDARRESARLKSSAEMVMARRIVP